MANVTKIYIDGNTFPVKEKLKAIGCRWDKDCLSWYAETQLLADLAKAIVEPTEAELAEDQAAKDAAEKPENTDSYPCGNRRYPWSR